MATPQLIEAFREHIRSRVNEEPCLNCGHPFKEHQQCDPSVKMTPNLKACLHRETDTEESILEPQPYVTETFPCHCPAWVPRA